MPKLPLDGHSSPQAHSARISRQVASDIDQEQQTDQPTARPLQSFALEADGDRNDPQDRQIRDRVGMTRYKVGKVSAATASRRPAVQRSA